MAKQLAVIVVLAGVGLHANIDPPFGFDQRHSPHITLAASLQTGVGTVYRQTIFRRPPFYKGQMPLTFQAGKRVRGPMTEMIVLYHDFGSFKNTFAYGQSQLAVAGIPDGAVTKDPSGTLLAEAHLAELSTGTGRQLDGAWITEVHYYPGGKVRFRCRSFIAIPDCFKTRETQTVGTKLEDYYFIWPLLGVI